jgi:hypothetical protein
MCQIASSTADAVDGTGDDGQFQIRLKGAVFNSVEGLEAGVH